jgi:hypothetical protein
MNVELPEVMTVVARDFRIPAGQNATHLTTGKQNRFVTAG